MQKKATFSCGQKRNNANRKGIPSQYDDKAILALNLFNHLTI
jgi:hypothetical protein